MAVSKRTRFEVLRRDDFTCRYCRSDEGELTVDHVTPVALGGTDRPDNLVAACRDCNSGKGSTGPDEHHVTDVAEDEIRWAAALAKAAEITATKALETRRFVSWFEDYWTRPSFDYPAPLPHDWAETITRFRTLGLGKSALMECADIALGRRAVQPHAKFKYFCGVCWTKVRDLQEAARQILAAEEG